jgi:putative transposase
MNSSPTDPDLNQQANNDGQEEFLRDLLRRAGGKVTAEVVSTAHAEFGIPRSTLFRLVARFRKTQRTSSLGAKKRGTQEGAVRLDSKTERIIAEQVESFWLKKEKPSIAALLSRIRVVCLTEGLPVPHRNTVQRRVSNLTPITVARKRGESEIEAASTPSPGQLSVSKPNALWQIDHTVVDVIVVDEQYRQPIGRPVLTLAIDVCTRMAAGFHLSLEAPSSVSVGLCLLHAVYDKTAWLNERGIEIPWPVAGIPEVLHCDNGAEFRSRALFSACKEYGMKLQFRPPATPRFGGHIERLIGTMMGAVHLLPGTTFGNVRIRGDYDSEDRAIFTLRELEKWIALELWKRKPRSPDLPKNYISIETPD